MKRRARSKLVGEARWRGESVFEEVDGGMCDEEFGGS